LEVINDLTDWLQTQLESRALSAYTVYTIGVEIEILTAGEKADAKNEK